MLFTCIADVDYYHAFIGCSLCHGSLDVSGVQRLGARRLDLVELGGHKNSHALLARVRPFLSRCVTML